MASEEAPNFLCRAGLGHDMEPRFPTPSEDDPIDVSSRKLSLSEPASNPHENAPVYYSLTPPEVRPLTTYF